MSMPHFKIPASPFKLGIALCLVFRYSTVFYFTYLLYGTTSLSSNFRITFGHYLQAHKWLYLEWWLIISHCSNMSWILQSYFKLKILTVTFSIFETTCLQYLPKNLSRAWHNQMHRRHETVKCQRYFIKYPLKRHHGDS